MCCAAHHPCTADARSRPGPALAALLCAIGLLGGTTAVWGQACLTDRGHWTPGPPYALAAAGDWLLHGDGADLVVSDLGNPSASVELGRIALGDPVWSISVTGTLVAVTDWWDSLYLVDISDPTSPALLAHHQPLAGERPYGAVIDGDHVFLAMRGEGLQVLDISDPSSPQVVGGVFVPGVDFIFDIIKAGDRLYLAADTGGLLVIDVSAPTAPVLLGSFTGSDDVSGVRVEGHLAYVAAGNQGLYVVDVGNPAAPAQLAHLALGGYARRLHKLGGHLFIADPFGSLHIVDVTDPALPVAVAQGPARTIDVTGHGTRLMVADPGSSGAAAGAIIRVLDVSLATAPVQIASISSGHYAQGVALTGQLALVANGLRGLAVLDLGGPGAPVERGRLALPGIARSVVARGQHAYVGGGSAVHVVDIADPDQPVPTATLPLPGFLTYDLAFAGPRLLVANGMNGLRVYDLADPAQPQPTGAFQPGAPVTRIAVDGDLGLAAGGSTAWTLDFSGTNAPVQLTQFSLPATALGVDLAGMVGLVAAGAAGVLSWNLADPALPVALDQYVPFPLFAHAVRMRGDRAWVAADTWYGVIELDVGDPAQLLATGHVDTSGSGRALAIDAGRVVLADWDAGVRVFGCEAIFADGFE